MRISIIFFFLFSFFLFGCGDEDFSDGYTGAEEGVDICQGVRSSWDAHAHGVQVDLEELWNEWEQNSCEEKECESKIDNKTQEILGYCYHVTCFDLAHFSAEREKERCWE